MAKVNIAQLELNTLTPKQLKELIDRAQGQVKQTESLRIEQLRSRIKKMCEDEGLTINQVMFSGRFGKVEPKFRDPASGKTWSGRGKKPTWLEGNEQEFAI